MKYSTDALSQQFLLVTLIFFNNIDPFLVMVHLDFRCSLLASPELETYTTRSPQTSGFQAVEGHYHCVV